MNGRQKAELTRLLDAFDASEEVRDLARAVGHRAFAAELHERRPFKEVVVCVVYFAFQRGSNEYRFKDITATTTFDSAAIARTYRLLSDELDSDIAPSDAHEDVKWIAAALEVDECVETAAHNVIEESIEAGLHTGVSSDGIAGGAVYLADFNHHHLLTQQEVAEVAGVTTVTLRHRYAEQATLLGDGEHASVPPKRRQLLGLE